MDITIGGAGPRRHVRQRLARHKRSKRVILTDNLTCTASAKLQKNLILERAIEEFQARQVGTAERRSKVQKQLGEPVGSIVGMRSRPATQVADISR